MNYTTYHNEIRSDIAKEFGLEAGGYAPTPAPALSVTQTLYLLNKYPNTDVFSGPSDKALAIAKRYGKLTKMWAKSHNA